MNTFKRLLTETILPDNYPVHDMYVYIVDNRFKRFDIFIGECRHVSTVGQWKKAGGYKEIRRCELFGHEGAKLGDMCHE